MAKIIAVSNQKGGVGKTTTSINLSASIAELGKQVLLVDLDPQGNTTMGCGVNKHALDYSVYDVLLQSTDIRQAIIMIKENGLHLLPSNADLTAAEVELLNVKERDRCLKRALLSIEKQFDYVIIDCPPSLNMLTVNALVAANSVLIPIQCEYFALEGLSDLLNTISHVTKRLNPELKIEGLLRTMFDARNKLSNEVSSQIKTHFEKRVFDTIIPRNIRLAEAPSHGLPVAYYDSACRGSVAYADLAMELQHKELAI